MNIFDNPKPIPRKLRNLFDYIESTKFKYTKKYYRELNKNYRQFYDFLDDIYNSWFPNKDYSDEHIAEEIFIREAKHKDLRNLYKYKFLALLRSIDRTYENIKHYFENGEKESYKDARILLRGFSLEGMIFLSEAHYYVEGKRTGWVCSKRNIANSREIFHAAKMVFVKKVSVNDLSSHIIMPTSVVLIRQFIEIRIKNALGIRTIHEKDGRIKRIPADKLIAIIEKYRNEIEFPIKISLLKKIHNWTQYYIHGGMIPESWIIEWAFHILSPLATYGESDEMYSAYGAIKITQIVFDNLEKDLKTLLNDNDLTIDKMQHPECLIID